MKKFILAATLFISGFSSAQQAPEGLDINVTDNDDFVGFEILEKNLKGRRVFMTGENHSYTDFNARLELKMLRYFYAKAGVRNFIIELGGARAQYINRYINDADTMAEKMLMATTSPKYMKLFRRLRKWNLTLPSDRRISVYGVDVERFNDLPLMRLSELLPKESVPADIRVSVESIHNAAGWLLKKGLDDYKSMVAKEYRSWGWGSSRQPFYMNPSIKLFIKAYDSLRGTFKTWLGKDYRQIDEAVNWLKEYRQWQDYDNTSFQYVWREETMYHKMTRLLDSLPAERFFGQFGRCHTAYTEQHGDCGWYGYHSVINKLKSRYFQNDTSVLTIGVFYERFYETGSSSTNDKEKLEVEIKSLVKKTKSNSTTLFDLHAADAELPLLSKKFSYAIVSNDFESFDSDTSLTDTTVAINSKDKKLKNGSSDIYLSYLFGRSWYIMSSNTISDHLEGKGIRSPGGEYKPMYHLEVLSTIRKGYYGYGTEFMGRTTLATSDSDKYQFGMGSFYLKTGFQTNQNKFYVLHGGTRLFYGRQALRYFRPSTNLFGSGDYERMAVNHSYGLGLDARAQFNITKWFQIGGGFGWLFDLSPKNWYMKKYGEPYNHDWLTSDMTAVYYNLNFAFRIPINTY